MENQILKLNSQTINAVFNYLVSKPYSEVAQIINAIQTDIQTNNKVDNEDTNE